MPTTGDGGSIAPWILAVLKALGTSANNYNNVALALWAASEGMPDYANNWLATERGGYGGSAFNSAGVFAYPTFAIGVKATADTIKQSNMNGIYVALREARSLSFIYDAINSAPWCDNCQGGRYPIALYQYLTGTVGGVQSPGRQFGVPVQEPTQPPVWDWSDHVHDAGKALTAAARKVSGYAAAIRRLP